MFNDAPAQNINRLYVCQTNGNLKGNIMYISK